MNGLEYDGSTCVHPPKFYRGVVYRQYARFGCVKAGFDSRLPDQTKLNEFWGERANKLPAKFAMFRLVAITERSANLF